VILDFEPGGLRELHWHPNADEWQYVIEGRVGVTMFGSHGRYRTETLGEGDVGYIPLGYGHSSPDALVAELCPDLTVALAVERRLGQDAADMADEFLVRARPERAAPLGFGSLLDRDSGLRAPEVDRRSGQVPEAAVRQTRARP
jgi:uncharacterized cupin superfamily protein